MHLMTKELENKFRQVGTQESNPDPLVIAKYFNPSGAGFWYATEYNPTDKIFFGYVSIFGDACDEWGNFSLDELQAFKGRFGLGIERDLHCSIKPISQFNIPSLNTK